MMVSNDKSKREAEEFYGSLSRKELQSMCKKYGLPARKSTSEMSNSLFSYFQKKDLHLESLRENMNGLQGDRCSPSPLTTYHAEAPLKLTRNLNQDNFRPLSSPREELNKGSTCNELESLSGGRAYNKEDFGGSIVYCEDALRSLFNSQGEGNAVFHKETLSSLNGRVEDSTQCCCRNINKGVFPEENISSAIRTYTKVPASFEFYASSDKGINLCVDLSSSPSDWIKKYNNQIPFCNNVASAKSHSLHQELGHIGESIKHIRSNLSVSVDRGEINGDHVQEEPSWIFKNNNIGFDLPDAANKASLQSPARRYAVARALDCLEKDQGPILSKPSCDVQKQLIPYAESCRKIGSTSSSDVHEEIIFNIESCIKIQNPKHDDEVCDDSNTQNCDNLEIDCVLPPECTARCSTEMQLSGAWRCCKDTSSSPCKNGEFLDMDDSKYNIGTEQAAVATTSENDHFRSYLPTCSKEQEWSNTASGRESSVCSQVDNLDQKACLKSDNLEPNEELKKKRPFTDSEGQYNCSKHDTKDLKSMKHSTGEVLPRSELVE
ncbi:uncharacterized protein LOC126665355 isoform X2 [Mercurialis annua]|uniref:uncharacterized protein LOC126665355 isoform X2 n=1 Tax=Mercurialis annua TaxID=3986 RepID=UPI00215EE9BE|nr:uncharacterized protein LOC126665355 isoform X2 [Mercurialis annua]